MLIIVPYKTGSESAKLLRDSLRIIRGQDYVKTVRNDARSKYRGRAGDVILNWGSHEIKTTGIHPDSRVINPPDLVELYSNKLTFFQSTRESGLESWVVKWFSSKQEVLEYLQRKHAAGDVFPKIVCRTKLNGHGGGDIVIYEPGMMWDAVQDRPATWVNIPDCRLYTVYRPKTHEYRAHIIDGQVRLVQQKVFIKTAERQAPLSWQVRNHTNGFTFVELRGDDRESWMNTFNGLLRRLIGQVPLKVYSADIIFGSRNGSKYVLEINTASGLSSISAPYYADAIANMVDNPAVV